MKPLFVYLLLLPLRLLAQSDSLPRPVSGTATAPLKPIEFREIPYSYVTRSSSTVRGRTTTSSTTHTGINRIYSYDGIDVDDPERELWRYMDAVKDKDVSNLHLQYDDILTREREADGIGMAFMLPGLVMVLVGASQAGSYDVELKRQQKAFASQPKPVGSPNLSNCGSWNNNGYGQWRCGDGPYAGVTVNYNPFTTPIPATPTPTAPTTVEQPKGIALTIGGSAAMLVGFIIMVSAPGNSDGTFLKAVQYYNRALKQKFSWEMQPYSQYGATGIRLVGHF